MNEEQFDRGNDPDHVISATEMQDVTDVLYSSDWWEGESPSNLEGLQYATNLRTLAAYEIERLPDLSELPNLEWVHLEVSDGWEGFPTPVGVFPRLQTLEIGGEALRQLPDELFAGGALSILEIFDAMNFKMIPSSLTINESLVTLHLDETGIEVLPDFIGDISSLELLFLVDNPHLGALPDVFDGLPNLRSLLLWNNDSLVALPPSIGEATALTAIEIYGASFETVPESIGNLQYLQEFLISSPVLTPLPASINGLRSLWLLDITGPESFSLPAALSGMHSLEDLYLRDTGLTSVPEGISTLPALENLDVARNKLTVLPEFLVEMAAREVGALKHINAFDNPLDFTDPVVITLSESILHF
ncbi:leucine-rich repeat domain-containing protein [uncultured Corynebacterium sp.]|uniref:leucine-rich repeat domain-containing protein n=1 Tax=uncultured Corynebacterium sp. TaxID=159447 RepID=UPI0025D9B367|nr:hypothetical protein [uncultured Corynebacterium sp.]